MRLLVSIVLLALAASVTCQRTEAATILAQDGKAHLPIQIAKSASREVHQAASDLQRILSHMTQSSFVLTEEPPEKAIFLGTRAEFPELLSADEGVESYRLLTRDGSLWIVGSSDLGLQNGIYELLHKLGYRQYFPSLAWEIIPERTTLSADYDVVERPAYHTRRLYQISRGEDAKWFVDWQRKNRMISGFDLNTVGLLRQQGKAYRQAPHLFTAGDHKGNEPKPLVDQAGLRELVLADAIERCNKDSTISTLGLSPTDGGGWPKTSSIGTPSDQMAYLSNSLADGLQAAGIDKKIAFLAYNEQSPPPKISLKAGSAIVLIATGYIYGGYTPGQLLKLWHEQRAEVGIYEYLDNPYLDLSYPGRSRASDLGYVLKTIEGFYQDGARYWVGEGSTCWALNGLGYYIASRALWNPTGDLSVEKVRAEFLADCFGPAAPAMGKFFHDLSKDARPLMSEDLLARLYKSLDEALNSAPTDAAKTRILQMAVYVRWVELMAKYQAADSSKRAPILKELTELMLTNYDAPVFTWHVVVRRPEFKGEKDYKALWKSQPTRALMTLAEREAIVAEGLKNHQRLSFTPQTYSTELAPLPAPEAPNENPMNFRVSKVQRLLWQPRSENETLNLRISGGWRPIGQKLPIKIAIGATENPLEGELGLDLTEDRAEVPADNSWHDVTLQAKTGGLHFIEINDGFDETEVEWPAGTHIVAASGAEACVYLRGTYSGYFVVPANCRIIAGYSETRVGSILSDKGQPIFRFSTLKGPEFFSIAIEPANHLRVFRIKDARGEKRLMTVPPYLARTPEELLVPKDALPEATPTDL